MSPQAPARQEFVILTRMRSGSSMLADLLARNGEPAPPAAPEAGLGD